MTVGPVRFPAPPGWRGACARVGRVPTVWARASAARDAHRGGAEDVSDGDGAAVRDRLVGAGVEAGDVAGRGDGDLAQAALGDRLDDGGGAADEAGGADGR